MELTYLLIVLKCVDPFFTLTHKKPCRIQIVLNIATPDNHTQKIIQSTSFLVSLKTTIIYSLLGTLKSTFQLQGHNHK